MTLSVVKGVASAAHCKTFGEELRQTCFRNLLLRARHVIFYPQQFDQIVVNIVNAICRAPISVAWLPDAACVDEILFGRLDSDVFDPFLPNALVPNKYHGHVRVAEKTDGGALIRETCDSVEIAKHIAPLAGRIECGVHDCKIVYPLL